MSMYREHILDHYKNPQNKGRIESFTHYSGKVNNPLCGDEVEVWIQMTRNKKQETNNTPLRPLSRGDALTSSASLLACPVPVTGEEGSREVLQDIGFDGHGCAICMASASLLTEWAKGKTIQQIEQITPETVTDLLGIPLTPVRLKCALLPRDGLLKALNLVNL